MDSDHPSVQHITRRFEKDMSDSSNSPPHRSSTASRSSRSSSVKSQAFTPASSPPPPPATALSSQEPLLPDPYNPYQSRAKHLSGRGSARPVAASEVSFARNSSSTISRDDSVSSFDRGPAHRTVSAQFNGRVAVSGPSPRVISPRQQSVAVNVPANAALDVSESKSNVVGSSGNTIRKPSLAQEMSRHVRSWASRRDSEDSFRSMASEPVSYSAQTYVSSNIWLAERKLDLVEDGIIHLEEKKASERRATIGDVFANESESQEFSSRIIRNLWANPVAHNPIPSGQSRRSGHSRSARQGHYRVQERGSLNPGAGPQYMNPPMPHAKSALTISINELEPHTGYDPSYPDSGAYAELSRAGRMAKFRRALKKADVARWIRYRANLRAERKNLS